MAKTIGEVKSETLFEVLSNMKAETLDKVLLDPLAKDGGPNNW